MHDPAVAHAQCRVSPASPSRKTGTPALAGSPCSAGIECAPATLAVLPACRVLLCYQSEQGQAPWLSWSLAQSPSHLSVAGTSWSNGTNLLGANEVSPVVS